jgi:hypothetical protein
MTKQDREQLEGFSETLRQTTETVTVLKTTVEQSLPGIQQATEQLSQNFLEFSQEISEKIGDCVARTQTSTHDIEVAFTTLEKKADKQDNLQAHRDIRKFVWELLGSTTLLACLVMLCKELYKWWIL